MIISDKPNEKIVPVIPIRDGIVFPHTESILTFGRPKSLAALESAFQGERVVCFVLQKNPKQNDPEPSDLYEMGTVSHIERMIRSEGEVNALVKGLARAKILSYEDKGTYLLAKIEEVDEPAIDSPEIKALSNHLISEFKKALSLGKQADFLVFMNIMSEISPSELADQIASTLDLKGTERQEILETIDIKRRLERVLEFLTKEVKVLEIEKKISTKTQEQFEKSAKEAILRERLKTIEKELGENEDSETKELLEKIKKAAMPKDVEEKARKELRKLQQTTPYNPEAGYIRNYLEWLIALPWSVKSKNNINIKTAEKMLDEDHYGLTKVKERIIEYLAVHKLAGRMKGPILCFAGPPGVGKTSIGKSIARALGRKFVKISLGGVRDEAEIRGHRRTYVGALPGRIIQGIKDAGTKNPVFMLDEIDKVGTDFRGDPSAALLEALDPEQNNMFSDHYLEVAFDLSDVMFITTANVLDTIPPALRDRLEIINFAGYTEDEKFHIGKDFLLKKQLEAHGLKQDNIEITDEALHHIIRRYTREAGVRNLEREMSAVFRKTAKGIAEGNKEKIVVKENSVAKFLGPAKFSATIIEKEDEVGMSTGLAWTEAGGDILFIEVAFMPGRGHLTLTGQLGDVMKESCQAAMSYIRARAKKFGIRENFFQKLDVHVHVPEGAVPKDGPSAGTAITTALVSAFTKIPVNHLLGMTGEITLRGRVLEIGGVKEKVIAAHRAGLKIIIMPKENKKDLEDVPKEVTKDLKFVFVSHLDEVLKVALTKPLPNYETEEEPKKLQIHKQPTPVD
ncbi:MAG: endopeptidase La [Candidatus Levybacteria bacterium RIFCSPHIGHO2_01_FULL_36_15]|nr:MAG: endopeptidase La [Candidatus Levybacteria bacterium RIFCSPHIGHO2_01_FULL_36_15]OGH38485.1 MAG: endopeptidase La [Candidatus Levybacteria bacterium RIFCSPLOWO2_01_FULL_36_10]